MTPVSQDFNKDYLSEWKIYLWKKLLLNTEGFDKGDVVVGNFMFFNDEEQYGLMYAEGQQVIGSIQNVGHRAYVNAFKGRTDSEFNK